MIDDRQFGDGYRPGRESDDDEALLAGVEDPGEDLDLILSYVQDRLDPARVAAVSQRLDDDPEFLHMAAPLLWAWGARPADVKPVPRAQLERSWDEFTKRAGFVHQKRKARRRRLRLLGIVLLALAAAAWLARAPLGAWYHDRRHYVAVEPVGEWVSVGHDAEARLAPGAELRVSRVVPDTGTDLAKLVGTAEFRITRSRTNTGTVAMRGFAVVTPAGEVATIRGTFTVRTAGDTTYVETHTPEVEEMLGYFAFPTRTLLDNKEGRSIVLQENERARMVKHHTPERIP